MVANTVVVDKDGGFPTGMVAIKKIARGTTVEAIESLDI